MQQMISPPRRGTMINPRASVAGIDAANGQCWYEIRALAAGRVEIFLYDVIGGWGITAQQFVSECKEAGVFEASAVDLHIHSPGGDVMQGFAIFNTLSRLKAKLDIWVDGVAASMASMIVCLPGATVHMPENAWLMVHKPWGGIAGDSDDMRDYAAWLDRNEALMLSAYMNKTGLGQEELEAMLKAETWLNGAEAVEKGFADTLEPELQAAACVNQNKLKDYQNMPEQINNLFGPRAEAPASQPQPTQNPAPQAANNPPAPQPTQQPMAGNIDITALAAQLQQQMQAANTERVSAVSAVFDAFPAFGSLKAECITDNAYRFHAKSADTDVLDADAYGPETHNRPGYVDVYVLSRTGDGTAGQPLLDKVNRTLNADEIRPLTDYVTIKSATIANYAVTAELEIPEGPDASTVLNNAIDVLRSYTTLSHRIKTVVPLSAIYAALQQSGVVRVRLISPVADLEAEAGKAPWCTAINVTRREVSSNDG